MKEAVKNGQQLPGGFVANLGKAAKSCEEKLRHNQDEWTKYASALGLATPEICKLWREKKLDDGISPESLRVQVVRVLKRNGLPVSSPGRPSKKRGKETG